MKVIIKHYARGREFAIGSVTKETWDYIQNEYEGNASRYMADVCLDHFDNNDDYDDYDIVNTCLNHCNDDLFHKTAGWFDNGCIEITNDTGKIIYKCTWDNPADFRYSGIPSDLAHEPIDWFVRYISIFSSPKGVILTGEFDIEGEFDPTKLTVLGTVVHYNGEHIPALVTGFEYAGKRINCSVESARSRMMDFTVIESKNYVGDYSKFPK